jgi:hypothetical protein
VNRCEICGSEKSVRVRKDLHLELQCDDCYEIIIETLLELEEENDERIEEDVVRPRVLPR